MRDSTADVVDRVWQNFRSKVVPESATTDQLEFARVTFFAGALAMFDMMIDITELLDDDEADAAFHAIAAELAAFDDAINPKAEGA